MIIFVLVKVQQDEASVRRDAHRARAEALHTRSALCTLRGDLAQRVHQADVFLTKHPHGAFGFTRAEIVTSRDNQQRTVDALAGLNCPSTKEH